jgi:colicin import membrane protein
MTTQPESSREDRFFGVSTTIEVPDKDAPKPDIEIEGDTTDTSGVAARPDKSASSTYTPPGEEDDGEDDEHYSERVKKRIAKLTWEREEVKRQHNESERMREEAIRAAQALAQRNAEYQNIITTGEAQLVERVKQGAAATAEIAKAEYRKAYETGDSELMLAAHERLIQAQAEMIQASQYDRDYQNRVAQQQYAQQQYVAQQQQRAAQQRVEQQQPPKPSSEAQSWAERNKWFNDPRHRDMTAIAYATHETLVRDRGFRPDSDAYYEELDAEIRRRFPDYFADGGQASATLRKPVTVVAAARRDNGSLPRKVKLTPTQVALAKKLGISVEQYADQVLKGMSNV